MWLAAALKGLGKYRRVQVNWLLHFKVATMTGIANYTGTSTIK
jgi:hypothetical protein